MIRIAIDGPGGAGKSTIAQRIARELGIEYIDTGAMYRGIGYKLHKEKVDLENQMALAQVLENTTVDFSHGVLFLDGQALNEEIRTPEIAQLASQCSALPLVREKLVALQQSMAKKKSLIMDGRDIGTNVMVHAEYKFYLNAKPEVRAQRRHQELVKKGKSVTLKQVLEEMNQRDYQDMNRKLNPLKKAEDAIEIDTTNHDIDGVVKKIMEEIKKHG